ncbi:trans-2,3-dihydro-3-hydroxyanthranilate isomerase [Methylomarinovum tepidoasis]|uniref:Trans-2,3-dihydro-3-hydroxyanthranilate isomerase n=1 Tax=Methylomarinovum tepidoasis TaxID=2840183 RepID=A0AAU9C3P6_9GAMM|nr:PhzF family phenazine biosynthesis protein [Methylomarinovum sp. IN45]BCX88047.1 trans-2,3-dihydro-3-hydroxyanthranilate isomerase [Methylomarinovum sp. IN45]
MTRQSYYIADAFTSQPFSGAQIGVFPNAEGINERQMLQLAGELNLPQTIFLQPGGEEATWRARIFNPRREMNFAAQAIVAAGYVLDHIGSVGYEDDSSTCSIATRRGVLPLYFIRDKDELKLVTFAMTVEPVVDRFAPTTEELAPMLGLQTQDIETQRFTPRIASTGRPFLIVPLRDSEAVRRACFDFKAWAQSTAPATAAQEILLFSARTRRPDVDFHARFVGPEIGPREDPPVGAGMPAFCGYLCSHEHIRKGTYVFTVERGVEGTRRSLLSLEMDHRGRDRLNLRIGGEAIITAEGGIRTP